MPNVKVKLPSLGDDAGNKATVSVFFKEVGEDIREGEDLVEMITDKATFTVPSSASGKVVELLVEEDQTVKVGEALAVVEIAD